MSDFSNADAAAESDDGHDAENSNDTTPSEVPATTEIDLDAIESDLAGVEAALTRLADGTYRVDEVTGDPIPDELLAVDPIARRAEPQAARS